MTRAHRFFSAFAILLALAMGSQNAYADDVADEADLQFQLGTEAYQRGDFRLALQHFLASNRLAPNRNVVFNIARSYEQLRAYPEAYRYYARALEDEPDASARARIKAALDQIRVRIVVLDITTEPPGATLYVDRRDLGARGESPRALGLAPGKYKVIAELSGHKPAETSVDASRIGETLAVKLKLEPILGRMTLDGEPRGAQVRVDDAASPPRCVMPCTLALPPGRHIIHVSQAGYRSSELPVEIAVGPGLTLRPRLERITGSLVVGSDEPGALIEIDNQPMGFTPAILTLPVGTHRVRLSLAGFRPLEQSVVIGAKRRTRLDARLIQAEEVIAASRATQAVEDAPSSVTIIPRLELRAFGYPTIAEAVRGVRGVYLWDDRSYVSVGVRGLGRLGSYGNRLLVLNDGHPANDNWIGSSFVGYDARTDLADVERIEVVRGPGSVLYGTNAFGGVINVVTRRREVDRGLEAGVSTTETSVGRGRVRADARLGPDAGIWTSVAGAHGEGRDFFFPEFVAETPPEIAGNARDVDGFETGTVQGHAWWKFLEAQWFLHTHSKQLPAAPFETLFADPRTRQTDTRAYVELKAEPKLSKSVELLSRAYLNHYRFRGFYPRSIAEDGLEVDTFDGNWWGIEQRAAVQPLEELRLTVGGEYQDHIQAEQHAINDFGELIKADFREQPYWVLAVYGLVDASLGSRVRFSGGARLDHYSTFGSSINPRAALIVVPYAGGNTKLIGGKAFRAPSVYELYYNDDGQTQVASVDVVDLEPESIYSLEIEHSHRFSPTVVGIVAAYTNYTTNLIDTLGSGDSSDPLYYDNSDTPLVTTGGELAIRRDWRQGYMVSASYSYQRSRFLASEQVSDLFSLSNDPSKRRVSNSPEHTASLKGALPVIGRAALLASRLTFEGPRWDRFETDGEEPQHSTDAFVIWDLVLTGEERRFGVGWGIGVYNAFDWRYALPVSDEFRQRTIPQSGRTLFASLDIAL